MRSDNGHTLRVPERLLACIDFYNYVGDEMAEFENISEHFTFVMVGDWSKASKGVQKVSADVQTTLIPFRARRSARLLKQ